MSFNSLKVREYFMHLVQIILLSRWMDREKSIAED